MKILKNFKSWLKKSRPKSKSIYVELLLLLLLAFGLAIGFFLAAYNLSSNYLDKYYSQIHYETKESKHYAARLQKYITQNNLQTTDKKDLDKWVLKQGILMVVIYKNDKVVYNRSGVDASSLEEDLTSKDFQMTFADGKAAVYIEGIYPYRLYNLAFFTVIILSFILFFSVVMLGIRYQMKKIQKLSQDIMVLEAGDLDYEIKTKGHDEIATLATGLNEMRLSLKEQFKQKDELMDANAKMVTSLSHDIRTPLTSIMLYTEILKADPKDEEKRQAYLAKIAQKTQQLKTMSDRLFEYSLVNIEQDVELEKKGSFKEVFYDRLSDMSGYLFQQGFTVEPQFTATKGQVAVHETYITRIMDNLTSNIVKYADQNKPVKILTGENQQYIWLLFENKSQNKPSKIDSNQIGLENVKKMMRKMGGGCDIQAQTDLFTVILKFKRIK